MDQKIESIKNKVKVLREKWDVYVEEIREDKELALEESIDESVGVEAVRGEFLGNTEQDVNKLSTLISKEKNQIAPSALEELILLKGEVQANIAFYSLTLDKLDSKDNSQETKSKDFEFLTSLKKFEETTLKFIDEALEIIRKPNEAASFIYAQLVTWTIGESNTKKHEVKKEDNDDNNFSGTSISGRSKGLERHITEVVKAYEKIGKKEAADVADVNELKANILALGRYKIKLNTCLVWAEEKKIYLLKESAPVDLSPTKDGRSTLKILNHLIDFCSLQIATKDAKCRKRFLENSPPDDLFIIDLALLFERADASWASLKETLILSRKIPFFLKARDIDALFKVMVEAANTLEVALEKARENANDKANLSEVLQEQLNSIQTVRVVIDAIKAFEWDRAEITIVGLCIDQLEANYNTLCDIIQESVLRFEPSTGGAKWKIIYTSNIRLFNKLQEKLFPNEEKEEKDNDEITSSKQSAADTTLKKNDFDSIEIECESLYYTFQKFSANLMTNKNAHKSLSWLLVQGKEFEKHRKTLDNYHINLRKKSMRLYRELSNDKKQSFLNSSSPTSERGELFIQSLNLLAGNLSLIKAVIDAEHKRIIDLIDNEVKHRQKARKAFSPLSLTLCSIVAVVAALLFLLPPIFFELGFVTLMTWAVGLFILGLAAFLAAWVPAVEGKETTRTVLRVIGVGLLATLGALAYGLMHIGIAYYMTQGAAVVGLTISTANMPAFIATTCVALKGFIAAHLLFLIPAIITPVLLILLACVVSHFVVKRNETEKERLNGAEKMVAVWKEKKVKLPFCSARNKAREAFKEKLSSVQNFAKKKNDELEAEFESKYIKDKRGYKSILDFAKDTWRTFVEKLKPLNLKKLGFLGIKQEVESLRTWYTKRKKRASNCNEYYPLALRLKDNPQLSQKVTFKDDMYGEAIEQQIQILESELNRVENDCWKEAAL